MYPDWVEKYHTKGTTVKVRKGNKYYLYSAKSVYDKNRKYPIAIQKYIGRITEEDGLILPKKIEFQLEVDKIVNLSEVLDKAKASDKEILSKIYVIEDEGIYYFGKLTQKELTTVKKYMDYEEGKARCK